MVKLRTALKNKVNNLFSAHGINLSKESLSSENGLKAVLETRFDLLVDLELKILVEQIRALNRSIAELEETISRESQKLEGHKNLTSIKGIGGLGAGILLSIIGDIRDFADEGKLAAYSASCRGSATPTRRSIPGALPNAALSWAGPRWCSAPGSRNATVPI